MPPRARKSAAAAETPPRKTAKKAAARKSTSTRTTRSRSAAMPAEEMAEALTASAEGIRSRAEASLEDTAARIRELQEKLLATAKRGGLAYLDAYEKNLASMLAVTERAAESTQLDWVSTLTSSYADYMRQMSDAFVKAARDIMR